MPAGTEPPVPGERPKPTARERTLMRRRLRTLQRRREALMMQVGGEVLESRRGSDSARLDGKTAELEQVDNEARVLANAPGNELTPRVFADRAAAIAKAAGVSAEVLDEERIAALKMGLVLGVARGSQEPPRLVVLRHDPPDAIPGRKWAHSSS